MKKYTIETLKEINYSYDGEHTVLQSDVDKANKLAAFIEQTRTSDTPQVGDIVEFTNKYGNYYGNAHIQSVTDKEMYICERPYVPFVEINEKQNQLYATSSGGAWSYIPKNIEYVGVKEKLFTDWGHCGARSNGAFEFKATVNVWRYTEGNHTYTTRTHDKFFLSIDSSPHPYKYLISKNGVSQTAFKTDKEYEAWLKTFHGVEEEGTSDYNKVVWTYKQEQKNVPLDEYFKISDAIVDSTLSNGSIQECKRIIDGTKITTYKPCQNEAILLDTEIEYMNAYKS